MNKTSRKPVLLLKIVLLSAMGLLAALVLWIGFEYLACPFYRFPDPKPFNGSHLFSPYAGCSSGRWLKANLHGHSRAWSVLTNGRENAPEEIFRTYRSLGYDVIAISDYQHINPLGEGQPSYIPDYEHGYGIRKNHHLCLGAGSVSWRDFPVGQSLHHKQHMLNIMRKHCEVLGIAHPDLRGGYLPEDFKYLTNYDLLEVLNNARFSIAHWDTALSSGHPAWILSGDDCHEIGNPEKAGRCLTLVYAADNHRETVLAALKTGRTIGVDRQHSGATFSEKAESIKNMPLPEEIRVSGDTLFIKVSRGAKEFRFIGQGGRLVRRTPASDTAVYLFGPEDTYIRTEIEFPDHEVFYLNPVVRCEGTSLNPMPPVKVDRARTLRFRLTVAGLILLLGAGGCYFVKYLTRSMH